MYIKCCKSYVPWIWSTHISHALSSYLLFWFYTIYELVGRYIYIYMYWIKCINVQYSFLWYLIYFVKIWDCFSSVVNKPSTSKSSSLKTLDQIKKNFLRILILNYDQRVTLSLLKIKNGFKLQKFLNEVHVKNYFYKVLVEIIFWWT
jgi:hypothetical protein